METPIKSFLIGIFGLASVGSLLSPARSPAGILVREGTTGPFVVDSALLIDKVYGIGIADSLALYQEGSISWFVQKLGGSDPEYRLEDNAIEQLFREEGRYRVSAYHDLRAIAVDTVTVETGDRFEIDRGTDDHLIVGNGSRFVDRSTNVARRLWSVTDPATGAKLDSSDAVAFEWTPIDTGSYLVHVFVESGSGKEHEEEWMVIVDPLPPPEPIVEAKPTPAPKPSEPKPWKPKEVTPAAAPVSNGCFVNHKLDGSNFMVEVKVPKREQISRWSDEATVFTFSPKNDCMFTGFDYFSKAGIDNIRISIACETPGICAGKPAAEIKVKGGYDAHSFARIDFQRLPIMNKDFKYRITIKAEAPGQLGFFPIESDRFSSTRSGSSYNGMDGTLRFKNESMETCVFNLRFTR